MLFMKLAMILKIIFSNCVPCLSLMRGFRIRIAQNRQQQHELKNMIANAAHDLKTVSDSNCSWAILIFVCLLSLYSYLLKLFNGFISICQPLSAFMHGIEIVRQIIQEDDGIQLPEFLFLFYFDDSKSKSISSAAAFHPAAAAIDGDGFIVTTSPLQTAN